MAQKVIPLRRASTAHAGSIDKSPPHSDIKSLKSEVGDRWPDLLEDLSPELSEALQNDGEHGPCPIHGGVDGFRFFDDYETTGGGVCNTCGPFADGIALLQEVNGWSFWETVKAIQKWLHENREDDEVVSQVGGDREEASSQEEPMQNQKALAYIKAVVEERAIPGHVAIEKYYKQRHLSIAPPPIIGFVEKEHYFDKETGTRVVLPAILAPLQDVNGEAVSILRTYLDPDGNGKANVSTPKKLTTAVRPGATKGAAIRLRDVENGILGLAEGIETAEAAFQATGVATWATVSAGGMANFEVPESEGVSRVVIFADNDASGVGQRSADTLARRLVAQGFEVSLLLPLVEDTDWNDVLAEGGEEPIRKALADSKPFDSTSSSLPKRMAKVIPSATSAEDEKVEADDPVCVLNKSHFVVPLGGTMCIATETRDPITGSLHITVGKMNDFNLRYRNWTTSTGNVAYLWLKSPKRRQYQGLVFAPGKETPGYYNLFRGFSVEPVKGKCHLFWHHLYFVICRGNRVHYRYLRKWLAHLFQRPDELPGVAIVIQGKQGTGKSIFVDLIGSLLGQHFLTLVRMEQLTGRFCSHLMDLLLVCANEALWGGDKAGEGALKAMITDPRMAVEFKGKDIIHVANYKRLIVTTNESWPVPMGMDDRRFLILEASDARKEDKGYFGTLAKQMGAGGREALLYDLLHEDLTGFDVRTKPKSTYGFDIKIRSAEPIARWWYEALYEGCTVSNSEFGDRWNSTPSKTGLHERFVTFCTTHRLRCLDKATFGKELRKLMPGCTVIDARIQVVQHADETVAALSGPPRRDHCYRLPSLQQCRQAFQEYSKSGPDIWPEGEGA